MDKYLNENLKYLNNCENEGRKSPSKSGKICKSLPTNFISIVRLKPLSTVELKKGKKNLKLIDTSTIKINEKSFNFDHIFPENSSHESVFNRSVLPYLEFSFEGYNLNIFSVGQTGSGKTFTLGTNNKENAIIQRSLQYIFSQIKSNQNKYQTVVKVSLVEIINEEIRDVINSNMPNKYINIKENLEGKIEITGLSECTVSGVDDTLSILNLLNIGKKANDVNQVKAHSIFTINILRTNKSDNTNIKQTINFVDMAGPDKSKKNDKTSIGFQTLNKVFNALADLDKKNGLFIPYKESKLTYLLKDYITTNSMSLVIGCINPCDIFVEESMYYMQMTSSVRNISIQLKKIDEINGNSQISQSDNTQEINRLKNILHTLLKEKNMHDLYNKEISSSLGDNYKKIDDLEYEISIFEKDEEIKTLKQNSQLLKEQLDKLTEQLNTLASQSQNDEKTIDDNIKSDYNYDENLGVALNFNILETFIKQLLDSNNTDLQNKINSSMEIFKSNLKKFEEKFKEIEYLSYSKSENIDELERRIKDLNSKLIEKIYTIDKGKVHTPSSSTPRTPNKDKTLTKHNSLVSLKSSSLKQIRKKINLNTNLTLDKTVSETKTNYSIIEAEQDFLSNAEKHFKNYNDILTKIVNLTLKLDEIKLEKINLIKKHQVEKDILMIDLNKLKNIEQLVQGQSQNENPNSNSRLTKIQQKLNGIINEKLNKINTLSDDNLKRLKEKENDLSTQINSLNLSLVEIQSKILSSLSNRPITEIQKELEEKKTKLEQVENKLQQIIVKEKENEDKLENFRIDLILKENQIIKLEKELKEKVLEYEDKAFQLEFEFCRKLKEHNRSHSVERPLTTFYTPVKPYIETLENIIEEGEEAVSKKILRRNQSTGNSNLYKKGNLKLAQSKANLQKVYSTKSLNKSSSKGSNLNVTYKSKK